MLMSTDDVRIREFHDLYQQIDDKAAILALLISQQEDASHEVHTPVPQNLGS